MSVRTSVMAAGVSARWLRDVVAGLLCAVALGCTDSDSTVLHGLDPLDPGTAEQPDSHAGLGSRVGATAVEAQRGPVEVRGGASASDSQRRSQLPGAAPPAAGMGDALGGANGEASSAVGSGALRCTPVHTHEPIPQRREATREVGRDTFENLAAELEIQCGNCHKAPAEHGGFSYTGAAEDLCTARGEHGKTPADMMLAGLMPFMIGGQQALGRRVQAWLDQGCSSGTYILPPEVPIGSAPDAGVGDMPDSDGPAVDFVIPREVGDALTDLGNCLPAAELWGSDADADARFATMTQFADLPEKLVETDVFTLDSELLATRGTFAYSPTYPLWSDDARKLRYVHVPQGQSINFDRAAQRFRIPPNTRFYKTFLREVVESDGVKRYRKLETRLIVTRERWQAALYGTYVWNSEETSAQLLGTGIDAAAGVLGEVYLNNQPFPDHVRPYLADERDPDALVSYAIPGAQRCVSCHRGSLAENFILGFTPVQLKRPAPGEGGLYNDVLPDERDQLERLIEKGIVRAASAADIANLEDSALPRRPRNADELNLQAYMLGNCSHCHNPNGYAADANPSLRRLNMAPGGAIFQFDFATLGADNSPYFPAVEPSPEDLVLSGWYRRMVLPAGAFTLADLGSSLPDTFPGYSFFNLHMPLHTGRLDCRLPVLVARWWGSTAGSPDVPGSSEPSAVADALAARALDDCRKYSDPKTEERLRMQWVLEDQTERDPYLPRNINWKVELPDWIRERELGPEFEALAAREYYQGYYFDQCRFPAESPEPEQVEPWMINVFTGRPKKPWSQIFAVTPGEHIFAAICSNCHGVSGDAQTGAARAIRYTSGARVADFVDGLIGPRSAPTANLATFDELGADGAARYLVWMANGGTTVSFGRTKEEEDVFFNAFVTARTSLRAPLPLYLDPGGRTLGDIRSARANMLQVARITCDQLRTNYGGDTRPTANPALTYDRAVTTGNWDAALGGRGEAMGVPMWRDVCALDNPLTDEIREAAANSGLAQTWLDRAVFNAGVMVYVYLRDGLSRGVIVPPRDACHLRYPSLN
jgi:mono/diheme cytochrome c family protein